MKKRFVVEKQHSDGTWGNSFNFYARKNLNVFDTLEAAIKGIKKYGGKNIKYRVVVEIGLGKQQ